MWTERMRMQWQHTSLIAAYIAEANRGSKGKPIQPEQINPMEHAHQSMRQTGIKLNSPEGFAALQQVAKQWPRS